MAILVDVAGIGAAGAAAAAGGAHLVPGFLQIVRVDEIGAITTDHFLRSVAQNGFAAWAHLNETALAVGHEDQILRGLENPAALISLLPQRLLGPSALGNVARDHGQADDLPGRRFDRRNAERDLDQLAILAPPHRLVMLDSLATGDTLEDLAGFIEAVGRHDQLDTFADGFFGRIAEDMFGRRVPARDDAMDRLG